VSCFAALNDLRNRCILEVRFRKELGRYESLTHLTRNKMSKEPQIDYSDESTCIYINKFRNLLLNLIPKLQNSPRASP
jgi:hypothetical protein